MHSFGRILISKSNLSMSRSLQSKQFGNQAIIHNTVKQEFYLKGSDKIKSIVQYVKDGEVFNLTESYVPEPLRGKGIGRELAKATFDYMNENDLKMKVTCTFLQKVFEENKQKYKHLIAD